MTPTLSKKLSAVLLLLFFVLGGFFVSVMTVTTKQHNRELTQRFNRSLAEHLASGRDLVKGGSVDEDAVAELFHMLMVVNPSIELYLLDGEGKILTFSAPPGKVKRSRVSLGPVRHFLAGVEDYPILGDDPRDPEGGKIFSAAALPGERGGYLYVILGGEEYETYAALLEGSYILRLGLLVVVGGVLFTLCAAILFFHQLTRRLRRLTARVERFRESGFTAHFPEGERTPRWAADEIDRLGETFQLMAGRIEEQIAALRKSDETRRELFTGISHDLRTPLTSLKGYLETLLMKGGSLADGERSDYLGTAMENAAKLEQRVEGLMELAQLDSPELKIQAEDFPVEELVEALVAKFRETASRQGVAVEAGYPEGLPFVHADIRLIERVLENLIDNALQSTARGGRVTIGLRREGGALRVQVTDTGRGMTAEELPHIFERHYQGGGRGRAGLGLAIVQRILERHGAAVDVESTPGRGTTFSFSLPCRR